jgi:cell division septum initiation protein DivIVA
MSRVAEVLAEQLRAPGFRTADRGYDQDGVRDHLAVVHALVTQVERRIAETERRADDLEARVVEVEAVNAAPPPEEDELLAVVFDGQRRADQLLVDAENTVARLTRDTEARIAELRDETERERLRALVAAKQEELEHTEAAVRTLEDDLHVTGEATRACREAVGDRLAEALTHLTSMSTERT